MLSSFDQRAMVEACLYILNKVGGSDKYHLFKILYFADRSSLANWGRKLISDEFFALEYGPVPSYLYDAEKGKANACAPELLKMFNESIEEDSDTGFLIPLREPDLDYLSDSDITELDRSIEENVKLTFKELKDKSHDSAWAIAFRKENGPKIISRIDMAMAAGASRAMIEYLEDELSWEPSIRMR